MFRRNWLIVLMVLATAVSAKAQTKPGTGDLIEPGQPDQTPAPGSRPLVFIQKGDLPIILSAPHGGRMPVPGSSVRTGKNILIKKGVKNTFTMAFDPNVDQVAYALADEIQKRTGKRPYIVVANFQRKFVDANRSADEGYEDEAGGKIWHQYHDAIESFRTEIQKKFNHRGLILDIHGHGRPGESGTIIRGTADWTSVRHLVEEFGKESVVGPNGLLGPLAAANNKFLPAVDQLDEKEYPTLNGGYITREYGSYAGGNFDAVQLELGGDYRKAAAIPKFTSTLADGVVQFLNRYLLVPAPAATEPAKTAAKGG